MYNFYEILTSSQVAVDSNIFTINTSNSPMTMDIAATLDASTECRLYDLRIKVSYVGY